MRILIVEDTADVGEAVVTSLAQGGAACDLVACLSDARDHLAVQGYDAIALDISLPDGDGRDLLREIRNTTSRPAWTPWTGAQTTTWSSPSTCASSKPGCAFSCAASRGAPTIA